MTILFGNTLAADHIYSNHIWGKFLQQGKMRFISKPRTIFQNIYFNFAIYTKFCRFWQENISFIAWIVWKLLTPKNVVVWMRESSCFGTPFPSQRVHGTQTVLKGVSQVVYPNFPLMQDKLSQKTSLFVRFEILGVFCNTLATDDMCSPHN